jgi:hypothetical protein
LATAVFYPLNFGQSTPITGSDTIKIINHGFKWLKIVITDNAGAGNVNAWVSGNSLGA